MFGNKLGWMISAGIVVVVAVLLYLMVQMDTVSPPTAFGRDTTVLQTLPPVGDITAVLPMTEAGDAGDAYRKAIASFYRNRGKYETFLENTKTDPATLAPLREGIDAVRDAARVASMTLFAQEPATIITYDSTATDVPAIRDVGLATARLGLLWKKENPKEALALFEGAFGLGAKLYLERVTYDECFAGLTLMGSSIKYIGELDPARADAAKSFEISRLALVNDHLIPTAKVVTAIDSRVLGKHVGDLFVIAESAQERMWRVEAIRKLGIVRFAAMTNKRKGDELGATRAARRYAKESDPAIAAAGKAASELTPEKFNGIR